LRKDYFHHPPARMDDEADLIAGLVDDLDGDAGCLLDPLASIGAVREGALNEGEAAARGLQQRHGTVAVLDRGRANLRHQQPPVRVHLGASRACRQVWRLRPLTFFPASYPRGPPASVVFTLWLSITAADGLASRPDRSRSSATKWWFIASHTPASRNAANQPYTVCRGGKYLGSIRHATPPRST
jgi:hypothetical protein